MSITEQHETVLPAGTYEADPVHSSVGFDVEYMGVGAFSGSVTDFRASLADGRLVGSARIESLQTQDENLHAHLMTPEFFDAERHPEVSFATASASGRGDRIELAGEITIRGVAQPATLEGTLTGPVTDPYGNTRYGLALRTTVDRTAFGILWNADMPDGGKALADAVTLHADLSLVQRA